MNPLQTRPTVYRYQHRQLLRGQNDHTKTQGRHLCRKQGPVPQHLLDFDSRWPQDKPDGTSEAGISSHVLSHSVPL